MNCTRILNVIVVRVGDFAVFLIEVLYVGSERKLLNYEKANLSVYLAAYARK